MAGAGDGEDAAMRARNKQAQSSWPLFPGSWGRGNPEQKEIFLIFSGGTSDGSLPSVLILVGAETFSLLSLLW